MFEGFFSRTESGVWGVLGPNSWALARVGFLMPARGVGRWARVALHQLVTLFVATQYLELYLLRAQREAALANLKISMLSVVCILKAQTFVVWQPRWRRVLRYCGAVAAEPAARAYCRRLTLFYWVLVLATFLATVLQPALLWATSAELRRAVRDGSQPVPHIFSSWVPWDKERVPGTVLTFAWHTLVCLYGAGVMAAYDSAIVVLMVCFGARLDQLRAGHFRLFDSLLSPVMFLYVVNCSVMICTSAYTLTSTSNTASKVLMAEYLIFGIAQLFVFCWHSNDVLHKSMLVGLGPYESAWWGGAGGRDVLLLGGQLGFSAALSAGPFAKLTLATFVNILKGAYSYYTLLRK